MGDSATAPPPPDTSKYSASQFDLANRSKEFAEQMWQYGQQQATSLSEMSQNFLSYAMPAMEDQFQWAKDMRDRYESDVLPQIQSLFEEADTYASKEEEDRQRGTAIQDVKSATEAQREAQLRKLEGYGIDPSETRYQALDKQAGVAEAAMSALAANQAGERTKQIGRDLRADAINVGTGFLGEANRAAQLGTSIGATGANVAIGASDAGIRAQQGALPYLGLGIDATNAAAGIVDTSYGRELDSAADKRAAEADLQGMGSLIGMGASFIPGLGAATQVAGKTGFGFAEGGEVEAPGGPTDDAGIIAVSDGEYVIPAGVVNKMGAQVLDKFVAKQTGTEPPSPKQALPIGGA